MRIAHVVQNLNFGGMERVLRELAIGLPPLGFDVHIVVTEYLGTFADGLEEVATLHQVPPMSRWSLIHPGPLAAVLRAIQPQVVHSHSGVWLKAARAAALARVPAHVHTEHGRELPIPVTDRFIDYLASRSTRVAVAVSEVLAGALRDTVVSDRCAVRTIPNGVDTERLAPNIERRLAVRRDLGIGEGVPVIGSVGRLEPVKNYRLAVEALAALNRLRNGGPAAILVIAGDGRERHAITAAARALGVAEQVRLLGWRSDARQLYQAFDLFTLVSRSEGTSISLLEAMSAGVCPVVTDVGGNRGVLGPDLSSLLVPDNDAEGVARAWHDLLEGAPTRERLGRVARARVQATFGLSIMLQSYASLYRSLIDPAAPVERPVPSVPHAARV